MRDRHRCVVSRRFDPGKALELTRLHGNLAQDDDRVLLSDDPNRAEPLQVAHIISHSLTRFHGSHQHDIGSEVSSKPPC